MVQTARPDADLVDGAWTKGSGGNVNMFDEIDDVVADDAATYVQSELNPVTSAMAVGLSNVTDPLSSINHVIRYKYQKDVAGGGTIGLTIQLRQGYVNEGAQGTLIHSEVIANINTGWVAGSYTLSNAEADAITDYNDLQLRFVANQS